MDPRSRNMADRSKSPNGINGEKRGLRRKLILKHFLSPGDVVMFTAAIRDLHRCYPKEFITDVRTTCPAFWEHNPYITPLRDDDPEARAIECHYHLINRSNHEPYHFIHGFIEDLNRQLKLNIRPTAFKGDLYLSNLERSWMSQVQEVAELEVPFWIIVAGGKYDYTIKWWETARYQEVVDHFKDRILFIQVGEQGHNHPPLQGVLDLRGKTDLRQLVRLVYHAQGVLCPVTLLMHLAAAVEVKGGRPQQRPCVVIAGGREPTHWEAYSHHQFIHTIGALPCCESGGCWRSRTIPLGDGDEKDRPQNLCVNVEGTLPRCMGMITSEEVIRRMNLYFDGGVIRYLNSAEREAARLALQKQEKANATGKAH
jgi:ADP-heptose:LPS heptosyltransferase